MSFENRSHYLNRQNGGPLALINHRTFNNTSNTDGKGTKEGGGGSSLYTPNPFEDNLNDESRSFTSISD